MSALPERAGRAPGRADGAMLDCSVGVMAYNEEANIADALCSMLGQEMSGARVTEVIVVASGCTDRTVAIVNELAAAEPRIRLIEQHRRQGKASAINSFIEAATAPVLLLVSADVIVEESAFDHLLRHFADPTVGMVGGHPVPVNNSDTFLGHTVHLQWHLHDAIARETPKLGEAIAFRNVVPSIPLDTAVDELNIQALVAQLGYRLVYEPRAVIYNRGPATVADFLRQRRRIYAGHLRTRDQQAYEAPTMSAWRAGRALLGSTFVTTPQGALWSAGAVGLEAAARLLGRYDVQRRDRTHAVWEMSTTTKQHIQSGASAAQHNVVVFHIVNFHRLELERGAQASRQLARRVADRIQQALGGVPVTLQEGGTAVAMLPGDRAAAERAAGAVLQLFEATPIIGAGRGPVTPVTLSCGIIAFPPSGQPRPAEVAAPLIELQSATPVTT